MNAIYCECVKEKKKFEISEPTTMCLLVLLYHLHQPISSSDKTNFYIKSKPCPVYTKQLQNVEAGREPWTQ